MTYFFNRKLLLTFLLIFFGLSFGLASKTEAASPYYVDNTCLNNGDGTAQTCAAGAGQAGPFNSITNAMAKSGGYAGDDQILLKSGDTFYETMTAPSAFSGTSGHDIIIGSYGAGVNPIITGEQQTLSWSVYSGHTYQAAVTVSPNMVWMTDGSGNTYRLINNATSQDVLENHEWYWVGNVLYVRDDAGSSAPSFTVHVPIRGTGISAAGKSYITIQDLIIKYTNSAGIQTTTLTTGWTLQRLDIGYSAFYTINLAAISGLDISKSVFHDSYRISNPALNLSVTAGGALSTITYNVFSNLSQTPIISISNNSTDFNIYNNTFAGNYSTIINNYSTSNTVNVKNNIFSASWGTGTNMIRSGSGSTMNFDYNTIVGHGRLPSAIMDETVTAGEHNIYSSAQMQSPLRYGLLAVTEDDVDPNWTNLVAIANSYGVYITGNVTGVQYNTWDSNYKTTVGTYIAQGHEIGAHTRTHPDMTQTPDLKVQYTGTCISSSLQVTSGYHLIVTSSGGTCPGGDSYDLDLTSASYDIYSEVKTYLEAHNISTTGTYASWVMAYTNVHSKWFAQGTIADIKTAAAFIGWDSANWYIDELNGSKADLEAMGWAGYTCKSFAWSNNSPARSSAQTTAEINAGFINARTVGSMADWNLGNGTDTYYLDDIGGSTFFNVRSQIMVTNNLTDLRQSHTWTGTNISYDVSNKPVSIAAGSSSIFNSSKITTPDHSDFNLNSGDWAFQTWIKPTAISGTQNIYSQATDANNYFRIYLDSNGAIHLLEYAAGYPVVDIKSDDGVVSAGAWGRIALYQNYNKIVGYWTADNSTVSTKIIDVSTAVKPVDYTGKPTIGAFATDDANYSDYFTGNIYSFALAVNPWRYSMAMLDAIAQNGLITTTLSHGEGSIARGMWFVFFDALNQYNGGNMTSGNIRMTTESGITDYLIANGRVLSDGRTYRVDIPNAGNFHLQSSSPAINSGTDVGLTSDIEGNLIASVPDMGAYEYVVAVDSTAPKISVVASSTTNMTATITWTTDENASSTVYYGETITYGFASTSDTLTTSHSITLSGLSSSTTYHFYVESTDVSGNTSSSSDYTLITANSGIYIAQTATGLGNGSSCANAHAITFFNTSGNWGSGDSQIGPGKTVHLCGIISTSLVLQGGGSLGHPVTIFFEPNAELSTAAWGNAASSAIYASGKNYIVIDGGTNGVIRNTDNGTGLGNSIDSRFILAAGNPSNWEVKNLTLANMYVRVEGEEEKDYGKGAEFSGVLTNISFHDNVVHDGNKVVFFSWYNGASSNIFAYNNTIYNCAIAITVGSGSVNSSIDNVQIHNNDFRRSFLWDGTLFIHQDFTHVYAVQTNTEVTNLKIYNNYYHGVCGSNINTSLFGEGSIISPLYYNNIFAMDADPGGICSNGAIYLKAGSNPIIANNTFHYAGSEQVAIYFASPVSGAIVKNNLFSNISTAIGPLNSSNVLESDNNLFSPDDKFLNGNGTWATISLTEWEVAHPTFELSSVTGAPLLDANFELQAGSAAINAGIDLSAYFTDDFSGVSRPQGSAWDIGAYEYVSTTTDNTPYVTFTSATSTTASTATITFTTDQSATSTIHYATDTYYNANSQTYDQASSSDTLNTSHSITLSGLAEYTQYHFYIEATNASGTATSSDYTFTTDDETNPTVTGFDITDATSSSLIIDINTFTGSDTSGSGVVGYLINEISDTPLAGAIGWLSSTWSTYTFVSDGVKTLYAWVKDAYNNISTSLVSDTVTIDSTAPTISAIASTTDTTTATITFTTNENATSSVSYGLTTSYNLASSSDILASTTHTINLSGLNSGSTYHFKIFSTDTYGNTSSSSDNTFYTTGTDSTPPTIDNISSSTTLTTATITFTTNEEATSTIYYGEDDSYGSTSTSNTPTTTHSILISSLATSTDYHFQIEVADASGNIATSSDYVFTTLTPTTYTVGGTISGLSGTVVIQNNSSDDISTTTSGAFTFSTPLADSASYAVTVLTNPTHQSCAVTNGSGTIDSANVSDITIACSNVAYCGDGTCNNGETCSTCSTDCGSCPSSGGGGGGSITVPQVTLASALGGNKQITLNWTNPSVTWYFSGVKILRKQNSAPASSGDTTATTVYTTNNALISSYIDTGLNDNQKYYYAIYSYYGSSYSQPV
ncbi:MAG: choice-of-anchor Q domain-containing protein, partial [Patescibacteria group bacterium]